MACIVSGRYIVFSFTMKSVASVADMYMCVEPVQVCITENVLLKVVILLKVGVSFTPSTLAPVESNEIGYQ